MPLGKTLCPELLNILPYGERAAIPNPQPPVLAMWPQDAFLWGLLPALVCYGGKVQMHFLHHIGGGDRVTARQGLSLPAGALPAPGA